MEINIILSNKIRLIPKYWVENYGLRRTKGWNIRFLLFKIEYRSKIPKLRGRVWGG